MIRMRITYYALKRIQVGDDWREPGDLVPEARDWKWKAANINEGQIAPVLVATLPEAAQEMLLDWEAAQEPEPVAEATDNKSGRKPKTSEKVA